MKIPAYPLYMGIQASFWMFFTMMSMISAIYRVQSAGLDPLQLVLIGTVLEITVFIFEIPTGIVADLYSRRLSVIIGYFLIGLGFMLEGAIPFFGTILLAQVIWGIGATFQSGAEEAWLADEIGEERLTNAYLRGSQFGQVGTLIGIFISVTLGRIALNLPILIGGFLIVCLAVVLAFFMPEIGFRPTPMPERNTYQKMVTTFREGVSLVRGRKLLTIILAIAAIYGLSSEGLDRLWEAHFIANFDFPAVGQLDTVTWFGIINLVQMVLVVGATEIIRRRVRVEVQLTAIRSLILINTVVVLGLITFGIAQSFALAVASIWAVYVFRRTGAPLYSAWFNKNLESGVRATVISMRGQLDALGQLVGGPVIGLVALQFGLRAAMVGVALMLTPAVWLYIRALRVAGGRGVTTDGEQGT
ncbi:MAG: MFS transporter [Candidatus Promineifilaceae bacterium]